jgi:hypothetical protein
VSTSQVADIQTKVIFKVFALLITTYHDQIIEQEDSKRDEGDSQRGSNA